MAAAALRCGTVPYIRPTKGGSSVHTPPITRRVLAAAATISLAGVSIAALFGTSAGATTLCRLGEDCPPPPPTCSCMTTTTARIRRTTTTAAPTTTVLPTTTTAAPTTTTAAPTTTEMEMPPVTVVVRTPRPPAPPAPQINLVTPAIQVPAPVVAAPATPVVALPRFTG